MKVRIGIGAGGGDLGAAELEGLCRTLLEVGFDSIWLSDVLTRPGVDPFVGLAWLSGRLPKLKIGTTFLLPGWNTLRLARQLAALDQLSGGRLLLVGVPGLAQGAEAQAVGVAPKERGALLDDVVPRLKRLLAGETLDIPGPAGLITDVHLEPAARQQPLDIWLGGTAPSALRRCGAIGDGWLPSLVSADEAREGRAVIEQVASDHGRAVDPEHFGVSIAYATEEPPGALVAAFERRARRAQLAEVLPVGWAALRALLEGYVEAGFSKFVLRPLVPVTSWTSELERLRNEVGDLQT
jgi:probable F420-dependent oxidoreductase